MNMKKQMKKYAAFAKRLLLVLFLTIAVGAFVFTFVACASNTTAPQSQNEETITPDDNPTGNDNDNTGGSTQPDGGNTTPDDNGGSGQNPDVNPDSPTNPDSPANPDQNTPASDPLEDFTTALAYVAGLDATTTLKVEFGGRVLSSKVLEYTHTENGGNIKTTTTTLNAADAKELYKTEESTASFGADEFASKFPVFTASVQPNLFKGATYDLQTRNGVTTLTFTLAKENVKTVLGLTDAEAQNIASDVSVTISVSNAPISFVATYTSSNGNTVTIETAYISQQ